MSDCRGWHLCFEFPSVFQHLVDDRKRTWFIITIIPKDSLSEDQVPPRGTVEKRSVKQKLEVIILRQKQ